MLKRLLGAVGALSLLTILVAAPAQAAQVPLFVGPNCSEPSQLLACLNLSILQWNAQLAAVPTPQTPRNVLDNGATTVQQRGTGAATCALNGAAITSAAYAADRWGCEVNVAVGAGQLTVITATPSAPPGFQASQKLVRNSGALLQPQCVYQEIPQAKVAAMQGQQVVFSTFIQALAGLAADQGAATQTANLLIITGTTADQGLATWTASPALTPAWAGVATQVNQSVALPTTPAWTRYTATAVIPTTALEAAVAICFTPTATGAGTTDGIAFTGSQLEQGTIATAYEFKNPGAELAEAQRYYYQLTETAAVAPIASCTSSSVTVAQCLIQTPVIMRVAAALTFATGFATPTTTAQTTLGACTGLVASTVVASTVAATGSFLVQCTATTVPAAGVATLLYSNGGTGTIKASADF